MKKIVLSLIAVTLIGVGLLFLYTLTQAAGKRDRSFAGVTINVD